jgi:branched-chain amino acid transport system substrate-binding protein
LKSIFQPGSRKETAVREKVYYRVKLVRCVVPILAVFVAMVLVTGHPLFAQDKTPIKIGFSIPQSGGLSPGGKSALLARQIWRDDVNARGGILGRPIQLIFYDDQSNVAQIPTIYSKLIDVDKVDILIGAYGNALQAPTLPVVKQRDLLLFGAFATWANEEFNYERYFQIAPFGRPDAEFPAGFTRLAARKGLKTIAFLVVDHEGTLRWLDSNRRAAKQHGMTVVYDQKFPINTVEFSSMLRAIFAVKPEAIYVAAFPNEAVAVVRALDEVGISDSVKIFGGGMFLHAGTLLEQLGPAVNGIITYNTYVPEKTMDYPGVRRFFDQYYTKAKEGNIDVLGYYMAPFNYALGQVIEQAVAATKTLDNKVLAKYMHEHEFDTVVGKFRFGPTGERTARVVFTQFQGVKGTGLDQYRRPGTQVIVDPPELVSGELRMPFTAARK